MKMNKIFVVMNLALWPWVLLADKGGVPSVLEKIDAEDVALNILVEGESASMEHRGFIVHSKHVFEVTDVSFSTNGVPDADRDVKTFEYQDYDDYVLLDDAYILAKVYIADLNYEGGLIILTSDTNALVRVQELVADGTLQQLRMLEWGERDMVGRFYYSDKTSLGKVIITLMNWTQESEFDVVFTRYTWDPV